MTTTLYPFTQLYFSIYTYHLTTTSNLTSNYHTIALISHASKVMLKILQARLQQYVNQKFQMYKLDLEKAEEPEIKLPISVG